MKFQGMLDTLQMSPRSDGQNSRSRKPPWHSGTKHPERVSEELVASRNEKAEVRNLAA